MNTRDAQPAPGLPAPPREPPELAPHLVRVETLTYPRRHVRWLTICGLLIAGATYVSLLRFMRWHDPSANFLPMDYTLTFGLAAILLAPVHEGLHVLAAVLHGVRWSRIRLGFRRGFIVVNFTEPVRIATMRIVLLAPLVVLGVPLLVFAAHSGDLQWLVLFAAHVGSTVADMYTWCRLRHADGRHYFFHDGGMGIYAPVGAAPGAAPTHAALHTATSLAVGALFVLAPLLVPTHALLGDMRISPATPIASDGDWQLTAFDFHTTEATRVVFSAPVLREGRLQGSVQRVELPLDSASGRLVVRHRVERTSDHVALLHVDVSVGHETLGVLRYRFPGSWLEVDVQQIETHRRVRLDTQSGLRLLTLRLLRASGAPEPPRRTEPAGSIDVLVSFRG